ncbi:hypothetical protein F4809DRAFT_639274 [Biscogniauxia mediterranea]|nr:hypothetical protein F4809DRAFT_639274 [Biscogniauxia mediterranea]
MFVVGIFRRYQLSPLRRNIVILRSVVLRPSPRVGFPTSCLKRFETTSAKTTSTATTVAPEKATPPKNVLPERLCIYHAGTTRIMLMACLRVTTLFMFVFFVFVVTPLYIDKEGLSSSAVKSALSGIIPLVFVSYVASPFVTFIHIRLPPYARQSREMLNRFVKNLPSNLELEITTMNFLAKPRLSKVMTSELRKDAGRFGLVNWTRDTTAENARRKWYMPRAIGKFSVQFNTMPRGPQFAGETLKMLNKK